LLGDFSSAEAVEDLRRQYGLDQPVLVQYLVYLKNVLTLDFGKSYATNRLAMEQIATVFPFSAQLAVGAVLVAVLIGIPAGLIAATSGRKWVDGLSMTGALVFVSIPNFYLGVLLITIFAVQLDLLPVTGVGNPAEPLSLLRHLLLPSLALGGGGAAIVARMTRSSVLEVMSREYIVTARAKGLAERGVILRHALKNAFIPVTTVMGLQVGRLLGGSVVVETVFARAGIGKLIVDSITARDYIQVQASIVVLALIFVLVNLITDLAYGLLDPRIRYA
jgi:ABC-type dipeptide/oligopeptide/nickel transport system permease component